MGNKQVCFRSEWPVGLRFCNLLNMSQCSNKECFVASFGSITDHSVSGVRVRVQCRQIQVPTPIPRVGAKNVLCLTVQVRIVVAGSGGSVQTVGARRFTGIISSFLFPIQSDNGTQSDNTVFYVFVF